MKLTLQQTGSRLFFKRIGEWTPDPTEAHDFATALSACLLSLQLGLVGVQLVEIFPGISEQDPWDVHVLQDGGIRGHDLGAPGL